MCVTQVQCGKLAFSQGNRALFWSKMGHFRRFGTAKIRRDFRGVFGRVPEGHKHRVTTPENLGKSRGPPQNPAEPSERPRRTLGETPAEPSERQISSGRVVPLGW